MPGIRRVAAGVPAGGQFAAHFRPESEVVLGGADVANARTPLAASETLKVSRFLAKHADTQRMLRGDVDDIAQDSVVSVLVSLANRRAEHMTPGLLASAAKQQLAAAINTRKHIRHEDARARRELQEIAEHERNLLGRHLTQKEIDDLASRIRNGWEDQRHKPRPDFHHGFEELSIDAFGEETLARWAGRDALVQEMPEPTGDMTAAGELAHDLERMAIAKTEARRRAWDALADTWGVPRTTRGLPADEAKRHERSIRGAGGVAAAAAAHLEGFDSGSLFAPFGTTSTNDRRAIARALVSRPAVADRLWSAALEAATSV